MVSPWLSCCCATELLDETARAKAESGAQLLVTQQPFLVQRYGHGRRQLGMTPRQIAVREAYKHLEQLSGASLALPISRTSAHMQSPFEWCMHNPLCRFVPSVS